MNDPLHRKLAQSLTARTPQIIPYLPYLLQDLEELGSSPTQMADLIKKHLSSPDDIQFLDLCCGKGAVSIHLAHRFGCRGKGVDLMPEFIEAACHKASLKGVQDLLAFEVGDVASAVETECGYDLVILGAAGDVLGKPLPTLRKLGQVLRPQGYILIDDAYAAEGTGMDYLERKDWLDAFLAAGFDVLEEQLSDLNQLREINERQQAFIRQRAKELSLQHPEDEDMFWDYVRDQQQECEDLQTRLTGVTFLLQKGD